jgi:hypothetical protein
MSRKRKPRNAVEAREWLKQFAGNLRGVQERPDEVPLNPDLANWVADAVDAYTLEKPTRRKPRARSMDVALGLERPAGRPKGTQMGGLQTAIEAHRRRLRGETWEKVSEHLGIGVRSLRRTCLLHAEAVAEHVWRHSPVPFGYDRKGDELVINEREAAVVRSLFARYASIGSSEEPVPAAFVALLREIAAEGIADKRGKPLDIHRVVLNRAYLGEAGRGVSSRRHTAIVDRALWRKAHRVHRALTK